MFQISWSTGATILGVISLVIGALIKIFGPKKNPLTGTVAELEKEMLQVKNDIKVLTEKVTNDEVKKQIEKLNERYDKLVEMVTQWLLNVKAKV